MKIGVVGTGYVGLVTGTCFADLGHTVLCMDKDKQKIHGLTKGLMPIYEPGLKELVLENMKKHRLSFTDNMKVLVQNSQFIFIAVQTPSTASGDVDVTYVKEASGEIARHMDDYKIIINKSTVPVGMADLVADIIRARKKVSCGFDVVSSPEFLREGTAIHDFMNPDRILIGAHDPQIGQKIADLYRSLSAEVLITDPRSAEMIKYASNAFLATKISFINEIANLCEKVGADVSQVSQGMGLDKRIGPAFLQAGAGYGGSCFPKDVSALSQIAKKNHYDFKILNAVVGVNKDQKLRVVQKLEKTLKTLKGKQLGILGLSFKPNTDDLREAVSLTVIPALLKKGAKIRAYDPVAMPKAKKVFKRIVYCRDSYEAAYKSDALVILTEWNEFKDLDLLKIKKLLKAPVILDGRNIYDPSKMKGLGFLYQGIGR